MILIHPNIPTISRHPIQESNNTRSSTVLVMISISLSSDHLGCAPKTDRELLTLSWALGHLGPCWWYILLQLPLLALLLAPSGPAIDSSTHWLICTCSCPFTTTARLNCKGYFWPCASTTVTTAFLARLLAEFVFYLFGMDSILICINFIASLYF